ncbi:MAG: hypothetical protein WAW85_12885 [Gordonia sp. (in: high G+C Gram-positive bacteria)]|uniref:hypothetical protein n=1 Tax=Gordonia sp. (in: high G+C Gram-positive bacteria) TaxID=84139 RepID=UPI003BB57A01
MPIPLIVAAVVAAGVASGGGGLALGGKGARDIKRAKSRIDAAVNRYDRRRKLTDARIARGNEQLAAYGEEQAVAVDRVINRMVEFMVRNEKKVRENQSLLVDGLEARAEEMGAVAGPGLSEGLGILGGLAGGAAAGAGAGAAAGAIAGAIGTASTGAAISGLSGAAASSATMAWLGGGALSAGGGGIAAGALVLNSVIVGPALLATGFAVGKQGAKATTKAVTAETEVEVAIAELDVFDGALEAVRKRCAELSGILDELTVRGVEALDVLESEPFEPQLHAGRFQRALILAKSVRDVVDTPIVGDDGTPTTASQTIVARFKGAAATETNDSSHHGPISVIVPTEPKEAAPVGAGEESNNG